MYTIDSTKSFIINTQTIIRDEMNVTIFESVVSLKDEKTGLKRLVLSAFKRERERKEKERRENVEIIIMSLFKNSSAVTFTN